MYCDGQQHARYTQHAPHHTHCIPHPTPQCSIQAGQVSPLLLFSSSLPTKTPGTVYSTYREPHEGGDTDEAYKPTVVNALPAGGKGKVGGRMKEEGRKDIRREKARRANTCAVTSSAEMWFLYRTRLIHTRSVNAHHVWSPLPNRW